MYRLKLHVEEIIYFNQNFITDVPVYKVQILAVIGLFCLVLFPPFYTCKWLCPVLDSPANTKGYRGKNKMRANKKTPIICPKKCTVNK